MWFVCSVFRFRTSNFEFCECSNVTFNSKFTIFFIFTEYNVVTFISGVEVLPGSRFIIPSLKVDETPSYTIRTYSFLRDFLPEWNSLTKKSQSKSRTLSSASEINSK
jgi:hypothetical protein